MLAVRRAQAGFTLLEALVAIVLVAGVGMALFGWVSNNLQNLGQVFQAEDLLNVEQAAMEYVLAINPLQNPSGTLDLGQYQAQWQAIPVEEPRRGTSGVGSWGSFRIGLYEMRITINRGQEAVSQFSFRQVGYERLTQAKFP
jgi:general secretion pathway protein I